MTRAPIFVTGSSRSGTTLVARMLGNHDDVHTLKELHFVEELWDPRQRGELDAAAMQDVAELLLHRARVSYNLPADRRAQASAARALLDATEPPAETAVDVFWAVMAHEAAAAGATRPCEQTPRNVFYLRPLLEVFPDARVIAMVRDPRDVVLSMKHWWRRGRLGATQETWRTALRRRVDYHPVFAALLWRSTVRALAAFDDPRVLVVRFEDLVDDPDAVLRRMCAHVGLSPDPHMLDVAVQNSSNVLDRTEPGPGIDRAVVGRGLTDLSATERWIVQRLAAAEMGTHGYDVVPVRPDTVGLLAAATTLVPKALAAFVANVRRTRSPWAAISRRLAP